jgi:glycosyltransferase involved in cell wall biosynthesis
MDNQKIRIIFFVAKVDKTSLMTLTLTLRNILLDIGYEVSIIEWRPALLARKLPTILMQTDTHKKTVFISVGALADAMATGIRFWKIGANWHFISWLHCHPWEDLRWERSWIVAAPYYLLWMLGLAGKHRIACVSNDVIANLPLTLRLKSFTVHNPVPSSPEAKGQESLTNDCEARSALAWIDEQKLLGRKVLVTFGLMRKRKNFEQAVRVLRTNNSLSLIIFGNGPEKESLLKLAEKLGVTERLSLMPFIDQPSRFCEYADLYVSNTHSEGFGLANVEAALTGIPTILPKLDINIEILGGFSNIVFFDKNSDDQFASAIMQALNQGRLAIKPTNPYQLKRFVKEWQQIIKET